MSKKTEETKIEKIVEEERRAKIDREAKEEELRKNLRMTSYKK